MNEESRHPYDTTPFYFDNEWALFWVTKLAVCSDTTII